MAFAVVRPSRHGRQTDPSCLSCSSERFPRRAHRTSAFTSRPLGDTPIQQEKTTEDGPTSPAEDTGRQLDPLEIVNHQSMFVHSDRSMKGDGNEHLSTSRTAQVLRLQISKLGFK